MSELATFLFARPSFWEGASRVLDLGATLQEYNSSLNFDQADKIAQQMDWEAVNQAWKSFEEDQIQQLELPFNE